MSKKAKSTAFLIPFFILSFFSGLNACDCEVESFEESLETSNVIFTGKVVELTTNWVSGGTKITFAIDSSWKRKIPMYFTVGTKTPPECGYEFSRGHTYLVYVKKEFSYVTTTCTRTKSIAEASDDIANLNAGIAPGELPGMQNTVLFISLAVAGGLLFVAFVVLRKRIWKPKGA